MSGACLYGIAEAARAEFYKSKVAVNEARLGVFIMPQVSSGLFLEDIMPPPFLFQAHAPLVLVQLMLTSQDGRQTDGHRRIRIMRKWG